MKTDKNIPQNHLKFFRSRILKGKKKQCTMPDLFASCFDTRSFIPIIGKKIKHKRIDLLASNQGKKE